MTTIARWPRILPRAHLPIPRRVPDTMAMPHLIGGWTADLLGALPDDGQHYEIIDGEMYVTPSPAVRHQGLLIELGARLREYLATAGDTHAVIPDCDFEFDERTVVRPDLTVIALRDGRLPGTLAEAGGASLVVEIVSPSSAITDREAKRRLYLRQKVAEYWIVDIEHRTIERWRPGAAAAEVVTARLAWHPAFAGEAFELDLAELFARV